MKLINMLANGELHLGLATERGVVDVTELEGKLDANAPKSMMEAIRMGRENALPYLREAEGLAERFLPEAGITYAPAVDDPEKIFCAGVNYRAHIEETRGSFTPADAPTFFAKFRNTRPRSLPSSAIPSRPTGAA